MKTNHRSGPLDVSALHLLHRAGQCAEVLFTNEAGKTDLTPRQYAILASVHQQPDISQTGLVEQTGVDRSTLADIVRRLVKKGLLQRKRTRRDARMYAVRLTPEGPVRTQFPQACGDPRRPAAAVGVEVGPARRFHRGAGRDRQGDEPRGPPVTAARISNRRASRGALSGAKRARRSRAYRPNPDLGRRSDVPSRTGACR